MGAGQISLDVDWKKVSQGLPVELAVKHGVRLQDPGYSANETTEMRDGYK